jgi:hypothetical protein
MARKVSKGAYLGVVKRVKYFRKSGLRDEKVGYGMHSQANHVRIPWYLLNLLLI